MKTIFILVLALITMSFVSEPVSVSEKTDSNLFLYGSLDRTVNIQIFESTDQGFILSQSYDATDNYVVKLNPLKEYQIWFSTEDGMRIIIYSEKGNPGNYGKGFDVNFIKRSLMFLHMHQIGTDWYLALTN
jgi:hypothetical protein